jgi:hypothetical protein
MTFKSRTPPLCRSCGKSIRKKTTSVYVEPERTQYQHDTMGIRYAISAKPVKTMDEAQRLSNQQIVSLKYTTDSDSNFEPLPETKRVRLFHEWDGETYVDEFFCSGTCAQAFGRMAAKSGKINSVAYVDAYKRQRGEKVK